MISNGGNDIVIEEQGNKTTVRFFISRAFLDNPSHYFIYTDDPYYIKKFQEKIKENWYRIME